MSTEIIGIGGAISQTAAEVQPVVKPRLLYIDNIRSFLIISVVLVHLSATYGFAGDWDYHEVGEVSPLAFFLVVLLQAIGTAFVMGLFFLIAGYFTPHATTAEAQKVSCWSVSGDWASRWCSLKSCSIRPSTTRSPCTKANSRDRFGATCHSIQAT